MRTYISKNLPLIGDVTLIFMVLIWGSTFFLIKEHLSYVDPVGMLFYRFALAAIVVGVILKAKNKPFFKNFSQGLIVGFFLWLIYLPQNIGMQFTTASNSGFITALFVAFVPLFSIFFFRSWPTMTRVFAAFISLLGLWFLTGGFHMMNKGDLITLISPVGVAFYVLFSDRFLKKDMDPLVLLFQQVIVVCLLSLIWMIIFDCSFTVTSQQTYWVLAYLAFFATVLTFGVYTYVQKISTPMKVALIFALEPVFAAFFACFFGGETFVFKQLVGGSLIVAALVISELPTLSSRSNDTSRNYSETRETVRL